MGKGLHELFKSIVNELNNALNNLGASGSEVSHLISEPRNFAEITRSPAEVKKGLAESNLEIGQTFNQQSEISNG